TSSATGCGACGPRRKAYRGQFWWWIDSIAHEDNLQQRLRDWTLTGSQGWRTHEHPNRGVFVFVRPEHPRTCSRTLQNVRLPRYRLESQHSSFHRCTSPFEMRSADALLKAC